MSRTFEIGCDDCNVCLWIGQADYIYTAEPHASRLANFMHAHHGHRLRFLDTEKAPEEWLEIDDDGEGKA
jgi:hypothetical protein